MENRPDRKLYLKEEFLKTLCLITKKKTKQKTLSTNRAKETERLKTQTCSRKRILDVLPSIQRPVRVETMEQ